MLPVSILCRKKNGEQTEAEPEPVYEEILPTSTERFMSTVCEAYVAIPTNTVGQNRQRNISYDLENCPAYGVHETNIS